MSLDTLRPERMVEFARTDRHGDVLEGIGVAASAGFAAVKLNAVVIRGFNDDEVIPLLHFARGAGVEIRFIEYMDVGGATRWSREQVVSQAEILAMIAREFGPAEPLPARAAAPAERFRLADGTTFGVIASTTAPFCRDCDRSRLTADGTWFLCLYATDGVNLRDVLRSGAGDAELRALVAGHLDRAHRPRRGAAAERPRSRCALPGRIAAC